MDWHQHVMTVAPHVMGIRTPNGSGTGFLIRRAEGRFWIATAAHVVRNAKTWGQVITVRHDAFDGPLTLYPLYPQDRNVFLHPRRDTAMISADLPTFRNDSFPEEAIECVPVDRTIRQGVEVGWLGYPYLVPDGEMCFFCGHVSGHGDGCYFIDGVAIPGVSGGPAFYLKGTAADRGVRILGSISAYIPNKADGEALPGLMVADDCTQWPGWAEEFE